MKCWPNFINYSVLISILQFEGKQKKFTNSKDLFQIMILLKILNFLFHFWNSYKLLQWLNCWIYCQWSKIVQNIIIRTVFWREIWIQRQSARRLVAAFFSTSPVIEGAVKWKVYRSEYPQHAQDHLFLSHKSAARITISYLTQSEICEVLLVPKRNSLWKWTLSCFCAFLPFFPQEVERPLVPLVSDQLIPLCSTFGACCTMPLGADPRIAGFCEMSWIIREYFM